MVQTQDLSLLGIFQTSKGTLYYIPPSGEMMNLMELEPRLARFSTLVLGGNGSVELFYLQDEVGIKVHTLEPGLL